MHIDWLAIAREKTRGISRKLSKNIKAAKLNYLSKNYTVKRKLDKNHLFFVNMQRDFGIILKTASNNVKKIKITDLNILQIL